MGSPNEMDEIKHESEVYHIDDASHIEDPKDALPVPVKIQQQHAAIYQEALEKYGSGDLDKAMERKLRRKLDRRIIPLLAVCSYAAIFGIKKDLHLHGTQYSWLSGVFYVGWLIWAIPSNLIMQKLPPAYYLAGNIFMWGALLMCQAAAKNFIVLVVLRVLSGAFEAIADPAFMLITSMFYLREEQPSRIAWWYSANGIGVAGGGLIGYAIGHIKGDLASWRYEFLIVGAVCCLWAIVLFFFLPNSPATIWGFTHEEKLMIIARLRKNQTGVENRVIKKEQVIEFFKDWKTYTFFFLGFIANVPNGGISNFSTLVIQGLGFNQLKTSLLGIPQGVLVVIWILGGALVNAKLPPNSRCLTCGLFMLPTIAGALGFLLAPTDAYVGRLICFYMTGSYQASFVIALSVLTSNTGGQTKKMLTSGIIWFGACVSNIASPFFWKSSQSPSYHEGIGSILVANILETLVFVFLWFMLRRENRTRDERRAAEIAANDGLDPQDTSNETAFADLTDWQNRNFRYVY